MKPRVLLKPADDRRALVGAVVVTDQVHVDVLGTWLSILTRNFLNSIVRRRWWVELIAVPSAVLSRRTGW